MLAGRLGFQPTAVQISGISLCSMRLCHPVLRKGSAFPATFAHFPPSAPSGRLSLPDGAEGVGWGSPAPERRSLSAQQAAKPQVIGKSPGRNLDKLGFQRCPSKLSVRSSGECPRSHFASPMFSSGARGSILMAAILSGGISKSCSTSIFACGAEAADEPLSDSA